MSARPFNLVDEPWIPVETNGGALELVGLHDLFMRSPSLVRIIDPSPLVAAGLYRLVFAVFHRAVPLQDDNAWTDAWEDMDSLTAVAEYLSTWRGRFDLLDDEAPFWQVSDLTAEHGMMPWTKLSTELNDNNNKVLFDHTSTIDPPPVEPARVARALIACQMFAVGAGRGTLGLYTFGSPLAGSLVSIPEGATIEQTLYANAQPTEGGEDQPIWERPPLTVDDVVNWAGGTWNGLASRLTWPSRSVRILRDTSEGTGQIRWISFTAGLRPDVGDGDRDPWVPYRSTKDGKMVPVKLDPGRVAWRDMHAMIEGAPDGERERVRAVSRLGLLGDTDRAPPLSWSLLIVGQAADRARVDAWRQERWQLPRAVLGDVVRLGLVKVAIKDVAEDAGGKVERFARAIAADVLRRGERIDWGQVRAHADSLPASTMYWSMLERSFPYFLGLLAEDPDSAIAWWRRATAEAVATSATSTHAALGRDVRELRAWARTGWRFDALANTLRDHGDMRKGGQA